MAKHRQSENHRASSAEWTARKRRRSPSLLLLGTTAAAISTVLVFGHATNNTADSPQVQLAAATIGIGGRGDPDAVNIPNKLNGNVLPFGFQYFPVQYPAGFDIDRSVAAGAPVLDDLIRTHSDEDPLLVVGYSEGALVAERVRRNLDPTDPDAPSTDSLLFVMIASAHIPNGGIFARFPGVGIPFIVTSTGPAQPSPYDTTYVTNEYDTYADFPAYFNPLSLANSLAAVWYAHPDVYYDNIDYNPLDPDNPPDGVLVKPVPKSGGGTDHYVFVRAAHLPLLAPVRQVFGAIGLTPLTEPVLGGVEPMLRLIVDMGYTDRTNANPEVHVQFSFITPPGRILETIAGIPGALGQGVNNFITGIGSIPGSIPAPIAPTNTPAINARSLPQENNDRPAVAAADPEPKPEQASPPTEESVATPTDSGPTLDEVTEDGNKATPNTSTKTTTPKKNVFTQLADTFTGFLSGKKKPAPSTPTSEPKDPTPSDSDSQGESEGQESDAA